MKLFPHDVEQLLHYWETRDKEFGRFAAPPRMGGTRYS